MAELIADPIIQETVIPNGMSINPLLDWAPMLGVPIWVFISIIFVVGFLLVVIYYVRKIKRLDSVRGWLDSLGGTQEEIQVWIISRTQRLSIVCMGIKDNVISYKDWTKIEMWYHNSPMARIIVGGNNGVVVSEDYHHTRDFIAETAFTQNCDTFNDNQDRLKEEQIERYHKLKDAGKSPEKPMIVKPISDFGAYDSHGRKCLMHIHPDGLPYFAYSQFDPLPFRKFFPMGNSATHFGGDAIENSRGYRIDRREQGFLEKYSIFLVCTGIAFIAIIAAWFVPFGRV